MTGSAHQLEPVMNESTPTTEEILTSPRQSRKAVARENALESRISSATNNAIDQVLLAGALMVELQKLQEHPLLRRKTKDMLRLAFGRSLSQQGDQRSARVSEADVMLFNYIFFRMFAVTPDLT